LVINSHNKGKFLQNQSLEEFLSHPQSHDHQNPWVGVYSQQDLAGFTGLVAQHSEPSDWIFLCGDLGTGKTTFVQNLLKSLDFEDTPTSPTFAILNVYSQLHQGEKKYLKDPRTITNYNNKIKDNLITTVLHLDVYRLNSAEDLKCVGLEWEMEQHTHHLVVIEWANLFPIKQWQTLCDDLHIPRPKRCLQWSIAYEHDDMRRCEVSWVDMVGD